MPQKSIRSATDERRAGYDDDAEGPGGTERHDRPPLDRLRGDEDRQSHNDPERCRSSAPDALEDHRGEDRRVRDTHRVVDVTGRLDPAARELGALVPGGATRLDEHRDEDE